MSQPVDANVAPAPLPARARNVAPWIITAAIGAALTPLVTGAAIYVAVRLARDAQAENATAVAALKEDIRAVTAEVRVSHTATWVDAKTTLNVCHANNERFTCSVTNLKNEALTACWIGHLAQKEGGGTMVSLPLCIGRLAPQETQQVSAPWRRGSADDICNSPGYGGTPRLDWSKCEFNVEGVNPTDPPVAASSSTGTPSPTTTAAATAAP